MARTTLADLQSRMAREAPQNPSAVDPIGDMIRQQDFMRGTPVRPGYQERLGDPSKVISGVPPSLNAPPPRQMAATDLGPEWELVDGPKAPVDYRPEPASPTPDEVARGRADAAFEPLGARGHVAETARSVAAERGSQAAHPMGGRKGEMGSPGGGLSPETLAELLRFLGGAR